VNSITIVTATLCVSRFRQQPSAQLSQRNTLVDMRIGGVPEAFNLPLYNLSEQPSEEGTTNAEQHTFVEVEGGTGALTSGLLEGEYDVIVALTEGLVCKIANGDDIVLLGTMVESPLCWAVSTSSASPYQSFEGLKGTTIGVSRYGSGSHLMASCEGRKKGWATNDLAYVVEVSIMAIVFPFCILSVQQRHDGTSTPTRPPHLRRTGAKPTAPSLSVFILACIRSCLYSCLPVILSFPVSSFSIVQRILARSCPI